MPIEDFKAPTDAERKLIENFSDGQYTIISEARPIKGSPDNTIRAELIRALLLGASAPPARGSAWITGKLDLKGQVVPAPLVLKSCFFEEDVILGYCTLPALCLNGSQLPALTAQRLLCEGSLHMQAGFQTTGLVDLTARRSQGS